MLRPTDSEAHATEVLIAANQRANTMATESQGLEPLERLKREFNEVTVRQAAFALEQIEQAKLGTQPAAERSQAETADGDTYFSLANVRLRTGDLAAAKTEAEASLKLQPNALGYVVLANTQMNANNLQAAAASASQALQLKPDDRAALLLKQTLQQRGVVVP